MNRYKHLPEYEDAINSYLDGDFNQACQIDPADIALADDLIYMAKACRPDPVFKLSLSNLLAEVSAVYRDTTQKSDDKKRNIMFKRLTLSLIAATLLVFLVIFALPALLNHTPDVNPPSQAQTTPADVVISLTPTQNTLLANLPFLPHIASASTPNDQGLFPNTNWTLNADLPSAPDKLMIYRQKPETELTVESASTAAAQLGVVGEVYQPEWSSDFIPVLEVIDASTRITFTHSVNHFDLIPDNGRVLEQHGALLPLQERAATLEEYLKRLGLLTFPYRIEEGLMYPTTLRVVRLVDGYPLEDFNPFDPWLWAKTSPQNKVSEVTSHTFEMSPIAEYPVISASQAWDDLINGRLQGRVIYILLPVINTKTERQIWLPTYTNGQRVDFINYYPQIESAARCCGDPAIFFNSIRVLGDITPLITQNQSDDILHVWGTIEETSSASQVLRMQGWETVSSVPESLEGLFSIQPDGGYVTLDDGERFMLVNPPADLPEATPLIFDGVFTDVERSVFEWSQIAEKQPCVSTSFFYQGPSSGFGGGGGPECDESESAIVGQGGSMITGAEETSDLIPQTPYQPGDEVSGEMGVLNITVTQSTDGSRNSNYSLSFYPDNQFWMAELRGDNLAELDSLNNLNVRLWGVYDLEGGQPIIHIQRFEKAYPEETIAVWMGTQEVQTISGRKVIVLNASDGVTYVLASSFLLPEEALAANILEGEDVYIEGAITPGEYFGGLPVLRETLAGIDPNLTSLEGYQLTTDKPYIIMVTNSPQEAMAGEARVEKAELVYYTPMLEMLVDFAADNDQRIIQPLWKFSGTLSEGRRFSVLVQAVDEKYLR